MVILLGSHTIRTSATTQKSIALSVGESELYALIKTASNLIEMQSMARDLGAQFSLRLWTDSTTARGASSKHGVQKMRYLDTAFLWIQNK
eukprot:761660-Karenia_brevis.AAC.1